MSYADQNAMSGNKIVALIVVALLHILLLYALVTGLAYNAASKVIKKLTTVDIKEPEKPKETPPPPPPKKDAAPPPVVAPPVKMDINPVPPPIETVQTVPPPAPVVPVIAPPAPVVAPPPPPPPKFQPKPATPKGSPSSWASTDDYPARALREQAAGVTGFQVTIGADGRVSGCTVTKSSGNAELDDTTCKKVTQRARFNPATDGEGQPTTGSYSGSIRWVIPTD